MKKTKVLVTGGAGFIGSHLTNRLTDEGYRVTVVDSLVKGKLENINRKINFLKLDITSEKFGHEVKKLKPQIIFHFAAQSSIKRSFESPLKDLQINLLATQSLLDLAKDLSLEKIIFASSAAVYRPTQKLPIKEEDSKEPISLYGLSKLCSEYLLKNYYPAHNLPYITLRFSNVYGEKQDTSGEGGVVAIFIDKILKGQQCIIFGDGSQTRDFIHVSDVIDTCILSLKRSTVGEFNISTAKETSVLSLYKNLLKLLGTKEKKLLKKHNYLESKRSSLSYQKFAKLTHWKPKVDLNAGLEDTSRYFKGLL